MTKEYDHKKIEQKWRHEWEKGGIYKTSTSPEATRGKPKCYVLDMFPFPSGDGLHVGHPKGYIASDIYSRFKKMNGYNILHPMGWDAFGLPAEQYAIKNKIHPRKAVEKNIARFKEQLSLVGFNYDWEREINTTDTEYYKWTQWIFLKLLEKGLAYESFEPVNWCPSCQTGLSNEDLDGNTCERCGTTVEKKPMRQWVLKITDYADRLIADLDTLNWPNHVKEAQRNWIGKSEGAIIKFEIRSTKSETNSKFEIQKTKHELEVFTTRPDTLFGATYCVVAPEHEIIDEYKMSIENWDDVEKYRAEVKKKTEIERTAEGKEKTGVRLEGITAINPVNNEELPIFIADYVLAHYGTGAIMAVPAHDERDFAFAQKFDLPIKEVISGGDISKEAYTGDGELINSGKYSGMPVEEAKKAVTEFAGGKLKTTYKLRDWVFSRQRYWGEPIPVIHCDSCKNRKQKVLILHGFEGSPRGNWFSWMKEKLEVRGFEVIIPELPDTNHPKVEGWLGTILPILEKFTEEDIIIGHSLGSKAALLAIEKVNKKLKHAYLFGSAIGELSNRGWEKMTEESPNSDVDALKKFWLTKTDYEAVTQLTDVTAIISKDDPYVPLNTHDDIPPEWEFKVWNGFGHFLERQAPELLEEILLSKNTGVVPVPEKDLPVKLPEVDSYEPSGTGESPLANIHDWVNVKCPKCGGDAKRETNTMPNWAGSSWYYLRYIDPRNQNALVDKEKEKYWSPVDVYVGGDHATRHLIYARFWHKFLFDEGVVNYSEPFRRLEFLGNILAEDGRKMSKRWGNVINPDDIVETYGADTLRVYEMFMGPFDQTSAWSTESIIGPRRFIEKVWRLFTRIEKREWKIETNGRLQTLYHQTIKKISEDIEEFKFNTAISKMMILINELEKEETIDSEMFVGFLKLFAPFAPHIADEIWHNLGNDTFMYNESWPKFDESKIKNETMVIAVQVNGKLRATFEVSSDISEDEVKEQAIGLAEVKKWIEEVASALSSSKGSGVPKKVIYVKNKLVSIVV